MSEVTPEQVAEWSESGFAGLEKSQLRAACLCLGIGAPTAMGIDGLRNKLLTHYGMVADKPESKEIKRSSVRMPPNMKSISNWPGKKFRIKAHPTKEEHGDRAYPISWEGEAFFIDPKKPFEDVPAPIYEIIVNAKYLSMTSRWDSVRQENVKTFTEYQRFPITLIGVTPGTESLPIDLRDWYIKDALANDLYASESRESLERIWSNLTDGVHPNREDKDSRTLDHWRREIAQLLGLTPEQLEQAA